MAVNVNFSATGVGFKITEPSLPLTIKNTNGVVIRMTADTGYKLVVPSRIYDWFDTTDGTDLRVSVSLLEWTPAQPSTAGTLKDSAVIRFNLQSTNATGNLVLKPTAQADGVNVSVVKDLEHTETRQTFDKITSIGQYTVQTTPATDYFILDGDTENNYQTLSDSNVGSLGQVTFNKTGSTVNNVSFVYNAPAEGVATWTIHSKAYPSKGVRIDCYNDGSFTTNLLNGAKYLNETVHVVIKAVEGYYFSKSPVYFYGGSSTKNDFTKVSDYEYYADIPIADTTNYTYVLISAEGVLDTKSYFTYNLTNCRISDNPEYVRYSKIFIVTPNEDYNFESAPTVTGANQVEVVKLTDGTYRISYTYNPDENVTITANAVESVKRYYLKYNLTNADTDTPAQEIKQGDNLTITVTGKNEGTNEFYKYEKLKQFVFTSAPTYTMAGNTIDFVKVNDYTYKATIIVTDNVQVTANADGKATLIKYRLQGCTGNPDCWIESDSTVKITVKADKGNIFENTNPPTFAYLTGDRRVMTKVNDTEYTCTLATDSSYNGYPYEATTITATAVEYVEPDTDTTITHGFINVYKPTQEQLASLTKWRFVQQTSGVERDDMGQYIYKLHKVFFNVPSKRNSTVQFAWHATDVICPAVDSEIITANCGTVAVTEQYQNSFDYEGFTDAKIYLPFIGFRDIDVNNVMGDSVTLKYKLNVLNADCIAILSTSKRNEIYTFEGVAGFDIPYMLNNYNNSINGNFAQNNVYMAGFTPYLQLFTKKPYIAENSPYGYKTNEWKKLSTINGYAEFQDVNLNLIHKNITQSELQKIRNLLLGGVFL